MEAPSLVTAKERQAIAEEIASKYLTFAARVSVSFYRERIVIVVYPDEAFKLPSLSVGALGKYTIVIKRED